MRQTFVIASVLVLIPFALIAADGPPAAPTRSTPGPLQPPFRWTLSPPLIAPADRPADPCVAVKDPTVVFHDGKWHVFSTIRSQKRTHQIEYVAFADWSKANESPRHILTVRDNYFCAPQVFYFTPHKKWYLLYQVGEPDRKPQLQPVLSTTTDLADPASWSKPTYLFDTGPDGLKGWIDFWIICDDTHARLFATSNDGRMWRSDTKLADFPKGWSQPQVVLQADIFEASHTYKIKGEPRYLTIVEAQAAGRRYYKAYHSDRLDGQWKPVADSVKNPFASLDNIEPVAGNRWTDSVSHGELLRAGVDEKMEIDPNNLKFLIQGVLDKDKAGKKYGEIPWRLGLLERK
ncbi:non-reducing end alpha-L-arabinofuranosidase family hydrolase [Humisphaera borealis]|uniref:non-reducing end alpha-L-arabinofuranosidase n=1 Tax=Humisphaera borealis TaxID=2807512 RepID=A0A7M2WUJ7_9BACT|nr:non-reducing end alpha-L-arabinofuranosidase family hydrolase [Humisphaera borealis]QOV88842.1 glycoside hydrolase [Humisphaera borealis]